MKRRKFLRDAGWSLLALGNPTLQMSHATCRHATGVGPTSLFLCGDIMTGRGIDQVLPHPSDPRLYEPYVDIATRYVELAEMASGTIPKPVDFAYVWGDALDEFDRHAPDVRIANLETSITTSDDYWKGKGIHYRMHPKNISCMTAAKIDCCVLSNNHILDWGYAGLAETLQTLERAKVRSAGAGRNKAEAAKPALLELAGKGRVIVFGFGSETSGIPRNWAATASQPGVNLLRDLSDESVREIAISVQALKRQGDIVVASIHWGGNWGYEIPQQHVAFAHKLVDDAAVDIIHGHSSHHAKGIEVYKEKPILYGCGDFLSDYEGIRGYESFRDDLAVMYFITMDPSAATLTSFVMTPLQMKRFRLNRASREDARWLRNRLGRESERLGTQVELNADQSLTLGWRD